MARTAVSILDAPRCALGEGLRLDGASGTLSWVDIPAGIAWERDATGRVTSAKLADELGFTARLTDGRRLAGAAEGLSIEGGAPAAPPGHGPGQALNDGVVHPSGRFLAFGSRDRAETAATGRLWLLGARWVETPWRFTVFNGPAFSPCGRWIWFTDSLAGTIWRAPVDPEGPSLGERTVFAQVPPGKGLPDGMACDAEGGLWVALWDGSGVTRFAPDGRVDREIALPVARVTSVAFLGGGRMGATTALPDGADPAALPDDDLSGRVLTFEVGVDGPPHPRLDAAAAATLTARAG